MPRHSFATGALLVAGFTCVPAFADAQTATQQSAAALDSVGLQDGTVLRGHVTVIRPGVDMIIVLLDGTSRTVSWSEVRSTDGPAFAFASRTPSPEVTVPPPPPAAPMERDLRDPGPGRVPIELVSVGRRLSVGQASIGLVGWGARVPALPQEICFTPCTLYVRPGLFPLYVGGDGVLPTVVRLDVPPSGERLHLRSPRTWMFGAMLGLEGGALATAVVGLDLLLFEPRASRTSPPDPGWQAAAWVMIGSAGVGLIADFVGFGLALRNGVASSEPVSAQSVLRSLRPGVAPLRDGAVATVAMPW